jgi:hypothetical protein
MSTPSITVRAGHPDFLDLPWDRPMAEWETERRLDLPKGISRHEVRFFAYGRGIYAIKELPRRAARHEYDMLRRLEEITAPAVHPVGLAERPWVDPGSETAAAVITVYLTHTFSYRELLSGWGFGDRRSQMLDAFAGLLVQLHLLGVYWGDCSLSNVLYRYDAGAVEVTMVDAETSQLHEELSDGQREDDLAIMEINVAGGMADIAASQGRDIDDADLDLGADITARYRGLWDEVTADELIGPHERYKITERMRRINDLGFEIADLQLIPQAGGDTMRVGLTVGSRQYHTRRLRELTGVEASEQQARQILSDLDRHVASDAAPAGSPIGAIRWRVEVFEPLLERIREITPLHTTDPVQAYCDYLHHRYVISSERRRDVPDDEAFEDWLAADQPGYPLG